MSNAIEDYMDALDYNVASLTSSLIAWRSFADDSIPIVTYRASAYGEKSVDVSTDLSELSADDSQTVKSIFSQHHGEKTIKFLREIEAVAKHFRGHLTQTPQEVEEDIPEASYPEGNHGNNIDDFE